MSPGGGLVRAAGGVVARQANGHTEVLVVHRPRHNDWSFPKGKLEAGEVDQDCARREVEEETGLRCRIVGELPATGYRDRYGRPKVVRYWLMTAGEGAFAPSSEVDEARWVSLADAATLLSYAHDRQLLEHIRLG